MFVMFNSFQHLVRSFVNPDLFKQDGLSNWTIINRRLPKAQLNHSSRFISDLLKNTSWTQSLLLF